MNNKTVTKIILVSLLVGSTLFVLHAAPQQSAGGANGSSKPSTKDLTPAVATAHSATSTVPVVGTPFALPYAIPVNRTTVVTVTIPLPSPVPLSGGVNLVRINAGKTATVLGQLHDDGVNGDAVAGDGLFSIQIPILEPDSKTFQLQLSIAYHGVLQRVLSPAINIFVTPTGTIPLPPDPGVAGAASLAGIDSDSDGLRDDVERLIATSFPTSEKIQYAALQLAKAYSTSLLDGANSPLAMSDDRSIAYAIDCLYYVSPGGASSIIGQIEASLANTATRVQAYLATQFSGSGADESLPSQSQSKACMVNPATLPN